MDARVLLHILEEVTSLPTAPYHEGAVIRHVEAFARERGLSCRRDPYGNVILLLEQHPGGADPLVLTAHMDHPGFEVAGVEDGLVRARWMGGVAADYFPDADVEVFGEEPVPGRIVKYNADEEGRVSEIFLEMDGEVPPDAFGSWALKPFRVDPPNLALRAADDLVGVAAILAVLELLWAREDKVNLLAVFTRAEEVGFLGATGLLKGDLLPKGAPVVTLECSGELPAVQLGRGPVVRVGDRLGVFDFGLTHFLCQVAEGIAGLFKDFAWQRALMDRGTCESTLFAAHGHPTACLAFPLANYHNSGEDGYSVAAEGIHLGDFFGGVTLLAEAARRWPREGPATLQRLIDGLEERSRPGMVRLANADLSG